MGVLDAARRQLQHRGRRPREVADEPHHEWVPPQAELAQVGEGDDLGREDGELVVVKTQRFQLRELDELGRERRETVVAENEGHQSLEVAEVGWKGGEVVTSEVEMFQPADLIQGQGAVNFLNLNFKLFIKYSLRSGAL